MKKLLILTLLLFSDVLFSQRILLSENFENSGLNFDSLPTNWFSLDADGTNPNYPLAKWKVRDSSAQFPGVNPALRSRAFNSRRSISIPWRAGDPVADDWIWTPILSSPIQTGDSLIFRMLLGTPVPELIGGVNLQNYIDTMQVWVCSDQDPLLAIQKLATIRSDDSDNVWKEYKFNLSSFSGQTICIGFRYYMNTTVDGLWCNIDNVFIGNRSAIGIQPISNEIPKRFDLKQNYPNPFNPTTNIEFDIPKLSQVNLTIYDITGQEIYTLVNDLLNAGTYRINFDASNLASGTYIYILKADDYSESNKMILIK